MRLPKNKVRKMLAGLWVVLLLIVVVLFWGGRGQSNTVGVMKAVTTGSPANAVGTPLPLDAAKGSDIQGAAVPSDAAGKSLVDPYFVQ